MTKITFDPPLLPLDDYARSGAKILRAWAYTDQNGNINGPEFVTCEYDQKTTPNDLGYVWYVHEEQGYWREAQLLPGYWSLPKIKVEEEK